MSVVLLVTTIDICNILYAKLCLMDLSNTLKNLNIKNDFKWNNKRICILQDLKYKFEVLNYQVNFVNTN